jgi:hypothetical protein
MIGGESTRSKGIFGEQYLRNEVRNKGKLANPLAAWRSRMG